MKDPAEDSWIGTQRVLETGDGPSTGGPNGRQLVLNRWNGVPLYLCIFLARNSVRHLDFDSHLTFRTFQNYVWQLRSRKWRGAPNRQIALRSST